MLNLANRDTTPEIMDDFNLSAEEVVPVLKGLGKMNALFGGHKSLISALKRFPVKNNDVVADWGCGGGDALIAIAKWARDRKLKLVLTGIDATPAAVAFARQESAAFNNIKYNCADVLDPAIVNNRADIVISSLFTHHFPDEYWIKLIRNMYAACRKGIIITDLHRHPVLYWAVVLITRIFTSNKMAQNDGPLSVKRGFKRHELQKLLKMAQIDNYKLTWMWAFRWRVIIYKS
jgi:SAM-dependent methyltransferase